METAPSTTKGTLLDEDLAYIILDAGRLIGQVDRLANGQWLGRRYNTERKPIEFIEGGVVTATSDEANGYICQWVPSETAKVLLSERRKNQKPRCRGASEDRRRMPKTDKQRAEG